MMDYQLLHNFLDTFFQHVKTFLFHFFKTKHYYTIKNLHQEKHFSFSLRAPPSRRTGSQWQHIFALEARPPAPCRALPLDGRAKARGKLAREPHACSSALWIKVRRCEWGAEWDTERGPRSLLTHPVSSESARSERTGFSALELLLSSSSILLLLPRAFDLSWLCSYLNAKMPAGTLERSSPSAVAATPASGESTPEKPRTLSESRKVCGRFSTGLISFSE